MSDSRLFLFITSAVFLLITIVSTNPISNTYHQLQTRTWDQAITMAKAFVANLTLEEKCNMTSGVDGRCIGNTLSIPRLNFSGLCFQDSPSGVGDRTVFSTAFAPGIQIAATWDRDLAYKRAVAIAKEFQGKGMHYILGPMMNMDRNARHGRNWEGFGSDPYLSGENAFAYVQGIQDQGVVATAKHYICNEQETHRYFSTADSKNQIDPSVSQSYSVNIDDKTMHEIYLWPFASSVAAGVGSVMCSFNQLNGTQACQNDKAQNGLLKGELEFPGNIMSDWGANKAGIESALGGLDIDMHMPGTQGLMGYALLAAVKNGSLSESKIDDMITRILAPYYLMGQDQGYPSVNLEQDAMGDNYKINRQVASAGMILLKNTNNILPFNITKNKFYSVYGAAGPSVDGFQALGGLAEEGALYEGGGSGFVEPAYAIDPLSALIAKARETHIQLRYITNQNDYNAINRSFHFYGGERTICLVFISAWSSEGSDRQDLHPLNNGDRLAQLVGSNCYKTIVIVNSVSQLNLEAWIDLPNVQAVIWSGMPGAEYGPALVDILFGDYNPGGKLVFTLAKNDSDYGTEISPTFESNYTEGVFLDYRHFDQFNITPRYSFGYGLSYTTFSFAKLDISKSDDDKHSASSQYRQRRMRPYSNFENSKLYESAYEITFTLTNTGKVSGSEVPQLYLGFPAEAQEPPKVLRGFERVYLDAGESKQVTLVLTQKDVSYWNIVNQKWTVAPGTYTVWISTSANNADIQLQSSFNV